MGRFLVALTLVVSLGACTQHEGDVCQTNADCAGDLVCTRRSGQELQHCVREGSDDGGTIPPDAPNDFDAGPPDAFVPDAGPPDAMP